MFQNSEMTNDNSYDAYEEDIALVSFYFEEPTIFEYTRHVTAAFKLLIRNHTYSSI